VYHPYLPSSLRTARRHETRWKLDLARKLSTLIRKDSTSTVRSVNHASDAAVMPVISADLCNEVRLAKEDYLKKSKEVSKVKLAFKKLKEEVARSVHLEPGSCALGKHRAAITRIGGSGFKCDRTLRVHLEELVADIRNTYNDGALKQIQLAEALAKHLCLKTCAHRMRVHFCPQHWLLCHLAKNSAFARSDPPLYSCRVV